MIFPRSCCLRLASCCRYYSKMDRSAHKPIQKAVNQPRQIFKYFLVVDFEATCDAGKMPKPQEVIEFPCLKVNSETFSIEAEFHRYVKPDVNRIITPFCTELTKIIQEMVDGQPNLQETLKDFEKWLISESLLPHNDSYTWAFVTCGDWDFLSLLFQQCRYLGIEMPHYCSQWINLKKPFFEATKIWPKGLTHMLNILKLDHEGTLHSGIDDAKTIVNVMKHLATNYGSVFKITTRL